MNILILFRAQQSYKNRSSLSERDEIETNILILFAE